MQIAVLSDVHGNIEAFKEVVASLQERNPDKIICLGDLVGYGPDPEEVVQEMIGAGYECILGNHEMALLTQEGRRKMNFQARENNVITKQLLSRSSLDYISELPTTVSMDTALFVHGFPPDSVYKYVFGQTAASILHLFATLEKQYFFVGHTHSLLLIGQQEKNIVKARLKKGKNFLEAGEKYFINVGSVGQPRDGDNHAKYVIWDTEEKSLEVIYCKYDYEKTIKKVNERGFPEVYGIRLR